MGIDTAKAERTVRELFGLAGIQIDGPQPWDIQVKNREFYPRLIQQASMGLGESYMDGWWDCAALEQFIEKVLRADLKNKVKGDWRLWLLPAQAILFNLQSKQRAYQVAEVHYDLGNDLYQ